MPDLDTLIADLKSDLADQLDWANKARVENVHSVAQIEQCEQAVAQMREVLEEGMEWEFLADELRGPVSKLVTLEDDLDLMKKQAGACMAYLNEIEKKSEAPKSVEEVDMLRSFYVQTIQETKQEFDACIEKGASISSFCEKAAEEILEFVKKVVNRATALKKDTVLSVIKWISKGADIALSIAEIANPEPISAYITTGIKWIIKAFTKMASEIRIYFRNKQSSLEELLEGLEPLDIAKAKVHDTLELIDAALEPLALIKTVGNIVKGLIITGVTVYLEAPISWRKNS
jgi:hypothetical protein